MHCELLIGSAAFWARAHADIAVASDRVLIQAMTFEGDDAGRGVADAVGASAARDRRVLVDDYIRHVINDHFLFLPFAGAAVRAEAAATRAMFDGLLQAGVGVRVTNPVGANPMRYAIRNHKKLIVADDIAYIGGINFSDHNFAWHDLMLRIADADAADFLAADFDATWRGAPSPGHIDLPNLRLIALDGRDNASGFAGVFSLIADARASIELVSAYPTFPFVDALGDAAARGVSVDIFTPLPTNKPMVRSYLSDEAAGRNIAIHFLREMTHLKGMLIDGRALVLGSSNFDFASYLGEEEFLAIVEDPALVQDFQDRVIAPARAQALPGNSYRPSRAHLAWSRAVLRMGEIVVGRMRTARRGAVDWRWLHRQ